MAWSPDDAPIRVSGCLDHSYAPLIGAATDKGLQAKMIYASSKEALKRSLTGVATELQANDGDDIEYETVLKSVSKGAR